MALPVLPATGDARASALREAGARTAGSTLAIGDLEIDLVRVAAGTKGAGTARDFYVAREPTSRGAFAAFVKETGYLTEAERAAKHAGDAALTAARTWSSPGFAQRDGQPVLFVSQVDAVAFTAWASAKTGRTVRLPTEAEHALALHAGAIAPARGGTSPLREWCAGQEGDEAAGAPDADQGFRVVADVPAGLAASLSAVPPLVPPGGPRGVAGVAPGAPKDDGGIGWLGVISGIAGAALVMLLVIGRRRRG